MTDELIRLSAREAVRRLKAGDISPEELIEAALARIAAVEPLVNALPTLAADRARERARALRKRGAATLLAGLPIAVKDLSTVSGVRTTHGSPIYAEEVPARSDIMVERLEANGALVLAKSNTPEFGAGADTFNEVFGATLNPWDRRMTCGGSSGGSAVALATGEIWLATGSDLGGSLRTPASFCSVVGLRPSPGRVASGPRDMPFDTLTVTGPMARDVADVALMLDAMVGPHPEDPLALAKPTRTFLAAALRPAAPRRVAYSPDLSIAPVDPEVASITQQAALRFAELGSAVEMAAPDFTGAPEAFDTLRAAGYVASMEPTLASDRHRLKSDIVWNIERGLVLSASTIGAAHRARGALYHRVAAFFRNHDLLLCPAASAPQFPVGERYPRSIAGHRVDNYIDWLRLASVITLTSCPAISVPCGFTKTGLPVGLQMIGPPRSEAALLSSAAAFEALLGLAGRVPMDP